MAVVGERDERSCEKKRKIKKKQINIQISFKEIFTYNNVTRKTGNG